MGNSDLRKVASLETCSLNSVSGSVVAVDAHNWLYKYLTTTVQWADEEDYTTEDGTEVANLIGVLRGLPGFLKRGITPIFVFDGDPEDQKEDEIEKRRRDREEAEARLKQAVERGDELEAARLRARAQKITPEIRKTTIELLRILDIPCVEAPAAGEAQASHMARQGVANYVVSDDYDSLLFGAPYTVRRFTGKGEAELMKLRRTLDDHGIDREDLVDAAILCGTDYNDGIHGVGPKTALKLVRKYDSLTEILENEDYSIPESTEIRRIFFEPSVEDDYSVSSITDPSFDLAREYVTNDWEIPSGLVKRDFQRLETAFSRY